MRKYELVLCLGAHWCGIGNNAMKISSLGTLEHIDKCCRTHDHRSFNINMLRKKYHYFNWRPYILYPTVGATKCLGDTKLIQRPRVLLGMYILPYLICLVFV